MADESEPEAFVRRHLRHNAVALGADFALFLIGLSFASRSTILPAFAEHLRAPNIVIGGIPAVMTVGWLLPSLFAAGHTETLPRRLPFVLRYTIWERAPFLVLAVTAFLLAGAAPALALAVLLLLLLVMTGAGGALLPAWMDILGAVAAPTSYGVCFLASAVFMGLSYAALALTREPPAVALALAAPSLEVFKVVFALAGVQLAAINVSGFNVLLEFAPVVGEQPTYVGLGNTLLAPVAFAAPLVAGVMADTLGFPSVFSVAALSGLVGWSLLVTRVEDPRRRRAAAAE